MIIQRICQSRWSVRCERAEEFRFCTSYTSDPSEAFSWRVKFTSLPLSQSMRQRKGTDSVDYTGQTYPKARALNTNLNTSFHRIGIISSGEVTTCSSLRLSISKMWYELSLACSCNMRVPEADLVRTVMAVTRSFRSSLDMKNQSRTCSSERRICFGSHIGRLCGGSRLRISLVKFCYKRINLHNSTLYRP